MSAVGASVVVVVTQAEGDLYAHPMVVVVGVEAPPTRDLTGGTRDFLEIKVETSILEKVGIPSGAR